VLSIADNYFSQFHLPVEYDIDLPRLDSEFRQFQQLVHPDRHAAASDEQRLKQQEGHPDNSGKTRHDVNRFTPCQLRACGGRGNRYGSGRGEGGPDE